MIAMLTAYMMYTGFRMALAPNGAPMQTMMMDVVRGAIVVTLVGNAGNFNQWIGTVFLTTIPNEVGQAINGSLGGSGPPVNGGAQFDAVWNTAYKAGLMVYNNLPSVSLKGVALTFCVFFFWGVALAAVAIGLLMFLASSVLMALLIAIGPIFIACALWPGSRAFFSGWIASCVSTVTAQILTVALMSLMLQVETAELGRIASNPANANEIGQIGSLLGVAALLGICSLLAKQIPAVAVGIAGGAYHNLNSIRQRDRGSWDSRQQANQYGTRSIWWRGQRERRVPGPTVRSVVLRRPLHVRVIAHVYCPCQRSLTDRHSACPVLPCRWGGDRGLRRADRGDGDRVVGRISHPSDLCDRRFH